MTELRSPSFDQPATLEVEGFTTPEGANIEPWTDGTAVGYRVTAPGKPDRYVLLNPSTATDSGNVEDTDVFLYFGEGDPKDTDQWEAITYIKIW